MVLRRPYLCAIVVTFGLATSGSAALIDNFDSYTSQAAFQAAWRPWSSDNSSMIWQPGAGVNGSNAIHGVTAVNYRMRNARDLDDFNAYLGSDQNPVKFEVMVYDADPAAPTPPNGARNFCEIRAYAGDGLPAYSSANVGLQGLIAMGMYNTPISDDNFHARVVYGGVSAWFSLNTPRTAGWHTLTSLIGDTWIKFFVDGVLDTTISLTDSKKLYAFDGVILGSGLTSGGYDVAFDNVLVNPEPVTVLILAAGLALPPRRRA